jgi:hypothetical protein
MTYAEKQVNWKITLRGLLYEKKMRRKLKIAAEARGSVENPQARTGDSDGLICGICGQFSLPTASRPVGSQAVGHICETPRGRRTIHRTHTDCRFHTSLSCDAVLVLSYFQTAADFSPTAVMLG